MSSSNCCFLTCIQISQEAGQVVWYSRLLKNFPQFVVIHTVKGFGIVNKAEVDVFLKFSCFFYDPVNVGNLMSGSSAFSKSSLNIWKFSVHVLFEASLREFCALFCWCVRWVQLYSSLNILWLSLLSLFLYIDMTISYTWFSWELKLSARPKRYIWLRFGQTFGPTFFFYMQAEWTELFDQPF